MRLEQQNLGNVGDMATIQRVLSVLSCMKRQLHGSVPLYCYFNGREHLYATNANEIGTTTVRVLGKHGYRSEGVAGYCYPTQAHYTIPLYRYWNPSIGDHLYTTNSLEIGFHHRSWHYEGIQCYVIPK